MSVIYYSLSKALEFATKNSYIVSWFKNDFKLSCCFIVFDDFDQFLTRRTNYKSLHELIIYPTKNTLNTCFTDRIDGRLVFDFDFDLQIPNNNMFDVSKWMADIEFIINKVSFELYKNIDSSEFVFVWSTSNNPAKISKHLTVNGLYYEDWIPMAKQFYCYFINKWQKYYNYCDAENFLDRQIVRKNGSLRFVGSTKPDGNFLLVLDNIMHTFEMSLIRPKISWDKTSEQSISYDQLVIPCHLSDNIISNAPLINYNDSTKSIKYENNDDVLNGFVYKNKKILGNEIIYHYRRVHPSFCIICNRTHWSDNAFIKEINGCRTFHCFHNHDKSINLAPVSDNIPISNVTPISDNIQYKNQQLIPQYSLMITI